MAEPVVVFATARPPADVPVELAEVGVRLQVRPLAPETILLDDAAVLVVDGSVDRLRALWLTKTLRARFGDDCPPVVFLLSEGESEVLPAFAHGADAVTGAVALPAQLRAVLRWGESRSRLRTKAEELFTAHQQLQKANALVRLDLELARRLQVSFLPARLPEVGQARFAAHYQPLGAVGGDFYDVFRLDERRVGFYIADAIGHGVPSSLLTVYLKKAVVAKEIVPGGYRLLPPNEVLDRLNRDLIAQDLAELPFVTMAYGLLDTFSGELSLARAASPHPLIIRDGQTVEVWRLHGRPLGVFDSDFELGRLQLGVGDRLVLFTDGALADSDAPDTDGLAPVLAAAGRVADGTLDQWITGLAAALGPPASQKDDITLLALEYGA